jgi:hypothetical protein
VTSPAEHNVPEFFSRIEGLSLTPGNKSAGFNAVVSTDVLKRLREMQISEEQHTHLLMRMRERILNAKLLPKKQLGRCGVVLDNGSWCPRCFITDPAFGGSIGADPSELERLRAQDAMEWIGSTMTYTPHNVDVPSAALALLVMFETWAEMARLQLLMEKFE